MLLLPFSKAICYIGIESITNCHEYTGRLLKYLAAIGALEQVSESQFTASHVTKNLTEKVAEAGVNH